MLNKPFQSSSSSTMVCQGWNSLWLCAHFLWLRAHSHDCVHILPRGPSSPSLSSSSSSLSSPLPACNNRGWFKFKSQPVTIYVRIRTQSEHSQQQSNIKCHNQTQRQEYIQYLQYSTDTMRDLNKISIRSTLVTSSSPRAAAASRRLLSARLIKNKMFCWSSGTLGWSLFTSGHLMCLQSTQSIWPSSGSGSLFLWVSLSWRFLKDTGWGKQICRAD